MTGAKIFLTIVLGIIFLIGITNALTGKDRRSCFTSLFGVLSVFFFVIGLGCFLFDGVESHDFKADNAVGQATNLLSFIAYDSGALFFIACSILCAISSGFLAVLRRLDALVQGREVTALAAPSATSDALPGGPTAPVTFDD